jgi:hypothetical protein
LTRATKNDALCRTSLFYDEKSAVMIDRTLRSKGANQVPLCGGAIASVRRPSCRLAYLSARVRHLHWYSTHHKNNEKALKHNKHVLNFGTALSTTRQTKNIRHQQQFILSTTHEMKANPWLARRNSWIVLLCTLFTAVKAYSQSSVFPIQKWTQQLQKGYQQRVAADPQFASKSVTEVLVAAGTQLTAEWNRRGANRLLSELDFVVPAILTAVFGKYYR